MLNPKAQRKSPAGRITWDRDMTLAWLDLTEVKEHAAKLVEELHRIKAGGTARGDKMVQIGKRMEKVLGDAAQFEHSRKLNFYKKAQLLTAVRAGLAAKDWATADTEAIITQLLTHRLRKPAKP